MPEDVAYKRFCAVTAAYTALQETGRSGDSNHFSDDSKAEEIKKRLATWGATGSRLSLLEKVRRERALDAERNAGKWWKTDITLYYLIGGAVRSQFPSPAALTQPVRFTRSFVGYSCCLHAISGSIYIEPKGKGQEVY
jgi:hypothetical protein